MEEMRSHNDKMEKKTQRLEEALDIKEEEANSLGKFYSMNIHGEYK